MRYLLDTDICVFIAKHRPREVQARFAELSPGDVGMSVITYGELLYGAHKSQYRKEVCERLAALERLVPVLAMDKPTCAAYGRIRAGLEARGKMIGANDLWIAAHALAAGLTLVTNKLGEFQRVPGLNIENWVKR